MSSPHEVASIDRVAQWIRRPTSNRKIVGSIPIVVSFLEKPNVFLDIDISTPNGRIDPLKHCWFSGRILACHAGDRGSIPRQCRTFLPAMCKYVTWLLKFDLLLTTRIVGSVVEFSPATRETGVRFPDNADFFFYITEILIFRKENRCE